MEENPPPLQLDYQSRASKAASVGWQNYPLASGALYAVVTGVWAFCWIPYGVGYSEINWDRRLSRIFILILAVGHLLVGLQLLRRARKHNRPLWLESICLAISLYCMLAVVNWMSHY